jgi:hypothetical protein
MNVKSNYTLLTSIFWLVKYNSLLIYLNILIFQAFYKMTGFFQAFYKMPDNLRHFINCLKFQVFYKMPEFRKYLSHIYLIFICLPLVTEDNFNNVRLHLNVAYT